jgi:hypothetical protein
MASKPDLGKSAAVSAAGVPDTAQRFFGKTHGSKPTFGESTYALPSWVAATATYNRLAREKGVGAFNRYKGAIKRPLNKLEHIWMKAVSSAQEQRRQGRPGFKMTPEARDIARRHEVGGANKSGTSVYEQALDRPDRPTSDTRGKVGGSGYHPHHGWYNYERYPGLSK